MFRASAIICLMVLMLTGHVAVAQDANETIALTALVHSFQLNVDPNTVVWCGLSWVSCSGGHIIELAFTSANHINGTIPTEIGLLSFMTEFSINSAMYLTGGIPTEVSGLSSLNIWEVGPSGLSGAIPTELVSLSTLTGLAFLGTQISALPTSFGNTGPPLELYMPGNLITNTNLNSLCSSRITAIDLSFNEISGAFPTCWNASSQLTYLSLASNQITGALPTQIGNLAHLTFLNMSSNPLGSFPHDFSTSITTLDISNCSLSGTIDFTWNLPPVQYMDISHNRLTDIGGWTTGTAHTIKTLYSNYNIQGTVPAFTGATSIEFLSMNYNGMGSDLSGLQAPSLKYLSVAGNHIVGSISYGIGVNMTYMDVSDNRFTVLPTSFGELLFLNASFNHLAGALPSNIGVSLNTLILSNNQFNGSIPSTLAEANLTHLEVSNNKLNGSIPAQLGNSNLTYLDVSSNLLTGSIAPELMNVLKDFGFLILSNNSLTGSLPVLFGTLPNAATAGTIRFDQNNITGTLPTEWAIYQPSEITLALNNITGTIPSEWGVNGLITLDLSFNVLFSSIPAALGSIDVLTNVNLKGNQLTGTIPTDLYRGVNGYATFLVMDNNFCPIIDFSTWAPVNDFPDSPGTCQACVSYTCQNGGTCTGGTNQTFTCHCATNYTGTNCETFQFVPPGTTTTHTTTTAAPTTTTSAHTTSTPTASPTSTPTTTPTAISSPSTLDSSTRAMVIVLPIIAVILVLHIAGIFESRR